MKYRNGNVALLAISLALASGCASRARVEAPPPAPILADGVTPAARPSVPSRAPRSYDRVVSRDAITQPGLFTVHRVGDRLLYEIPVAQLGHDMLLLRRADGTPAGESSIVRWERRGSRMLLRQRSYQVRADPAQPIHRAVDALTEGTIVAAFEIEAFGPDSSAVIDVTRLFTTNVPDFAAVSSVVGDRSFLEDVRAFPDNIEVMAIQTGIVPPSAELPGAMARPSGRPEMRSVRANWSMLRLPEKPMMPRLFDKRVGWFSTPIIDYGRPEHETVTRRFIHRFRLEKRDAFAAVSDPVEPIVFWIDPATPDWLVPFVRAGVEEWQPTFEDAGFSNAIMAKEAPVDDPTWSMHDARNSMIYWRPSTISNATGGQIVDPRSGEIIKAEVNMYHNIIGLMRNWYFIQASPLDERARTFPFPDSLMGRLVQNVVAHEVGHAIGFPHNMKASAMYPADSLRSPDFVRRMGHAPSIMDYARFNYVAQPEDSVPLETLVPRVGPYDRFAVAWGHTPIAGAATPDDELAILDSWAQVQDSVPWLRFSTEGASGDPSEQTEAVGDGDAVASTALALRNLERVMGYLLPATEQPGQDYTLAKDLYDEAVAQWGRYMGHVVALVGGAESQERFGGGERFRPVERERQHDAVLFLAREAFHAPAYFTDASLLRRIEPEGVVARLRDAQSDVLEALLSSRRLARLIEYEALQTPDARAYTVADLLADLRDGVWTELDDRSVRIDVFRRNLQRTYVETLARHVAAESTARQITSSNSSRSSSSDARALLRGELIELRRVVGDAIPRAADANTRLHLRDLEAEIAGVLDLRT